MFSVEMLRYEELPKSITDGMSNNGCGKKYASYLVIWHHGHIIGVYSDAMEIEDARFCRDLDWIQDEIKKAYELGLSDKKGV